MPHINQVGRHKRLFDAAGNHGSKRLLNTACPGVLTLALTVSDSHKVCADQGMMRPAGGNC